MTGVRRRDAALGVPRPVQLCAQPGQQQVTTTHHCHRRCRRRNPKCVVASAGMQADMETLHKVLHSRHVTYQFNHGKPMACSAVAQLLGNTLYYKRFFPYYTFNLCAGLDEQGRCAGGGVGGRRRRRRRWSGWVERWWRRRRAGQRTPGRAGRLVVGQCSGRLQPRLGGQRRTGGAGLRLFCWGCVGHVHTKTQKFL